MPKAPINLRIGVVQFAPKIGQIHANLSTARDLCRKIQPQSLDLLCFPEMAFTGYVFENATAIAPYLEHPRTGMTSQFCSELAKKLQCYVVAGFPEKLSPEELARDKTSPEDRYTRSDEGVLTKIEQVGANSAILYGPDGEWVGGYRKTHLYKTDLTWAKPGTGFATYTLPPPLQTITLGICMDLNPQIPDWTRTEGPYEIADHCISNKSNLLILLNAWLDSGQELEEKHDWHTLNYWAARMRPLWSNGSSNDSDSSREEQDTPERPLVSDSGNNETVVIICNRGGQENGITFAGSSAIFSMQPASGRPKLLGMLGRREEVVYIWNIQI